MNKAEQAAIQASGVPKASAATLARWAAPALAPLAAATMLLLMLLLPAAPAAAAEAGAAGLVLEPAVAAQPLFAAALVDLESRPAKLAQRPGRVTVVNFWARWCGPCKVEIPELVALHARGNVDVVGIALESEPAPVKDFARAYEMAYPVLLARDGGIDLMRSLGNARAGLPFTLVLDGRGAVAALRLGLMTPAQLEAALAHAQAKSPTAAPAQR